MDEDEIDDIAACLIDIAIILTRSDSNCCDYTPEEILYRLGTKFFYDEEIKSIEDSLEDLKVNSKPREYH